MSDVELIVNDSKRKNKEYMPRLIRDAGRLSAAIVEYQFAEMRIEDGKEFSMTNYEEALKKLMVLTLYDIEMVSECMGVRCEVKAKLGDRIKKVAKKIQERILIDGE